MMPGLCLTMGRNDYQKINQKGFASLKLWVPIYHWKQKKRCGCCGFFVDAVETDFGFDIEIYKQKPVAESGVVPPVQQEQFMESMPY
jgi:hypothetical protein